MKLYRLQPAGSAERLWAVESPDTPGLVRAVADPFDPRPEGAPIALAGARLHAPIAPTKILAIGLNYRAHAAEMQKPLPVEPLLFAKPPSAVVGPGDAIALPARSSVVHHEGEVAVVLGRRVRRAGLAEARQAVLGLTCLNDVTARDLQKLDVQYTRAKGFDTFAPVGPCVALGADPAAPRALRTSVNGVLRQSGNTGDLIFSILDLVCFVSGVMTLEPGDVISTGTPSGVGPLLPGDVVRVEVEGVGVLENPVVAAD